MPGELATTTDVARIEAPVTWKAYLMCAFASFGGIYFGYDSGYINGVNNMGQWISLFGDNPDKGLTSPHSSLIVSILSCGTFFGAIVAGDVADIIGRKWTVIIGCFVYAIGCMVQMLTGVTSSDALGVIVGGRLIAGIGVGFESAIVILYMSEIVSFHPRGVPCPAPFWPPSSH
jgi:MFS family permease